VAEGNGSVNSQPDKAQELYERARAARQQAQILAARHRAARHDAEETMRLIRAARERAEEVTALWAAARTGRLRYSPYARLQARMASMPVIEQAKGIIMAQCGWTEDQAFDALRRASQRENIKLRDLATKIVATATHPALAPSRAHPKRQSGTAISGTPRAGTPPGHLRVR
jgi:ANTAR domain